MRLGEAADDSTVALTPGETVELCLPETPTTGYRWQVVAEGSPACAIATAADAPSSGAPGRGGERCWTIIAIRDGAGEIALERRRSWETAGEPAGVFKLHIRVGGASG